MAVGWLVRAVDRMRGAGPGEAMDFATGVGGEQEEGGFGFACRTGWGM